MIGLLMVVVWLVRVGMIDSLRTSFKIQIRIILNIFLLSTSKCISCHEWKMCLKDVSTFIHLFFKWNCIESISLQGGYYFYLVVKLVWCLDIIEFVFCQIAMAIKNRLINFCLYMITLHFSYQQLMNSVFSYLLFLQDLMWR